MTLLLEQFDKLLALFKPHCADTETMRELQDLLHREQDWATAHYLGSRIRSKTIAAIKRGDARGEAQFYFEEMCARTLYNLSNPKKPFEPDSPYWVIPMALKLARTLEIDSRKVAEIATS